MKKYFPSTFAGPTLLVIVAGILSRGTGFLREVVFAGYFGINEKFDIYLTGTVIPFIINTSIYYIAQNYLIPLYHSKINSEHEQREIINNNFKLFFIIASVITLILFSLKDIVINSYLWNSSYYARHLAVNIFVITIFTLPFNAGFSVLAAYYQAKLKFKYPAILPVIHNLFIIISVIGGNKIWGIYSIPIGYLLGYLFQFLTLVFLYDDKRNILSSFRNIKPNLSVNKLFLVIIFIEIVNQLYLFIDRYFLNFVEAGGIAALNYSGVLFNLPITIISFSLATVSFPVFSELIEQGKTEMLRIYFYRLLFMIAGIFIPLSFVFYLLGDEIIKIIFQRSNFSYSDTIAAFKALKMYTISLLFFAVFSITYKLMFSLGLSRLLLLYALAIFIIKIALNFILVSKINYSGLALSSSVSYIIMSVVCFITIMKKLNLKEVSLKAG